MLFAVSGIEVSPLVPFAAAFCVSFFTSMGGVSGAFLLLPFQVSLLGYTAPSVSATNQVFNIVAIPSGVYRFWREGRMVWPLTWIVVAGTLPGVLVGAIVRVLYLPDPNQFKVFASAVLLYIGIRMFRDLLRNKNGSQRKNRREESFQKSLKERQSKPGRTEVRISASQDLYAVTLTHLSFRRLGYTFNNEQYYAPIWGIFMLSLVVGMIGGVYGIGGGAIIAPFLVTFFGLPVYTIAGATLMGTLVTSVAGVVFYQAIAVYYPTMSVAPDWLLGILFGLGGMAGMYSGACCQRHVPAKAIKWMLAGIIVFTALKYAINALWG